MARFKISAGCLNRYFLPSLSLLSFIFVFWFQISGQKLSVPSSLMLPSPPPPKQQPKQQPKRQPKRQQPKQQQPRHHRERISQDNNHTLLIIVMSSKREFASRIPAIRNTWGNEDRLPEGVHILYIVGDHLKVKNETATKQQQQQKEQREEIVASDLAKEAGLEDSSIIFTLHNTADDEYPPVYKIAATIQQIAARYFHTKSDMTKNASFRWLFKADDDGYINIPNLLSFIATRNKSHNKLGYWGRRGVGRKEDRDGIRSIGISTYCLGGPGYLLTRSSVRAMAWTMEDTLNQILQAGSKRNSLWHSDILVGLSSVHVGYPSCWPDRNSTAHDRFFFDRNAAKNGTENVTDDTLAQLISYHPLKEYHKMMTIHNRVTNMTNNKNNTNSNSNKS